MATRVLFVCLGNICRSPTAEAVFRQMAADSGLAVEVDSAGTGAWHVGEPADARMRRAAKQRGYDLTSQARQVDRDDFSAFDLVIAMDQSNLTELERQCPPELRKRLSLMRDRDEAGSPEDVPDPYYGGPRGFEEVLDIVERCSRQLVTELRESR